MKDSRFNIWVERGDSVYVFNGLSGALLRIPKEDHQPVLDWVNGGDGLNCSPKVLAQLARGLMLVPDDADEVESLARRYADSRNATNRFALTIVTSLGCNFDCPYCFEAKHPSIMDSDVQDLVLQVLDEQLPHIANFAVTWFGGEPLVGKKPLLELSDRFIDRCDRANVEYGAGIITNGYLLDPETCAQLRDRRVSNAQVGLDGPPDIHDRMRPLAGGNPSFWHIVKNLHHAVEYMQITIRVNLDAANFGRTEELLKILAAEGFSQKLSVYSAQLVAVADAGAPSASYGQCFTNHKFARAELEFDTMAQAYGFTSHSLPRPTGAPCTAVRKNELVVGSKGELYKCWESVGNPNETIGNIRDYKDINGRLHKWLGYNPFANSECRGCIALPVCMGGCARHAIDVLQYENRCGTFRHTYRERVLNFIEASEQSGFTSIAPAPALANRMETR
jgi:uncharacterized protein